MRHLLSTLILILFASPVFAGETALLTKKTSGGFMTPNRAQSLLCEMYMDKVVITEATADIQTTREVGYKLQGDLLSLINSARSGELTDGNPVMDAPTTEYTALGVDVLLKATGSKAYLNQAPAAQTLILLLDQNCD